MNGRFHICISRIPYRAYIYRILVRILILHQGDQSWRISISSASTRSVAIVSGRIDIYSARIREFSRQYCRDANSGDLIDKVSSATYTSLCSLFSGTLHILRYYFFRGYLFMENRQNIENLADISLSRGKVYYTVG
jgi:hypothetical protein